MINSNLHAHAYDNRTEQLNKAKTVKTPFIDVSKYENDEGKLFIKNTIVTTLLILYKIYILSILQNKFSLCI